MIIVHIKNNQSRSTESIYIQNLMYIILMENYQIDYKLLLSIIQCDSGQVKTTVVKGTLFSKLIFNWKIIAPQCNVGYVCVLVTQPCPALCDPMDCSPPGSSVHRIFQANILEWIAIHFSTGSSLPRDQTQVSCTAGSFFAV